MNSEKLVERLPRDHAFYRDHYHHIIIGLMALMLVMIVLVCVQLYQMQHRPLPLFNARQPDGKIMPLTAFDQPNLLPATILQWASKAATSAYTFDYVNYNKQLALARPYFTEAGWQDYLQSVNNLIQTLVQNQLIINGIVSGAPIISNQGSLPGQPNVWRVQIPFLVTYQSANTTTKKNFYVLMIITGVPTSMNPQGIGIDQFVMV